MDRRQSFHTATKAVIAVFGLECAGEQCDKQERANDSGAHPAARPKAGDVAFGRCHDVLARAEQFFRLYHHAS